MAVLFLGGFLLTRPNSPLAVSSVGPSRVEMGQEVRQSSEPAMQAAAPHAITIPSFYEPSIQMSASAEAPPSVIPGNEVAIPIGEGAPVSPEPPIVEIPAANNEPEFYGDAIPVAPVQLAARTETQSEAQAIAQGTSASQGSSSFPQGFSSIGRPSSANTPSVNSGASYGSTGSASTAAESAATSLSATDIARITQPISAGVDLSAIEVSAEQCVAGESTCAPPVTLSFPRSRWSLSKGLLSTATVSAQAISGAIPVRFALTFTLQGLNGSNTPVSLSLTPNAVNNVPMATTAQGQQKIYEFDFANTNSAGSGQLKNIHVKLIFSVVQGVSVLQGGSYLQFERSGFESLTTPWSPGGANPEVTDSVPFIRVANANYRVLLAP